MSAELKTEKIDQRCPSPLVPSGETAHPNVQSVKLPSVRVGHSGSPEESGRGS